MHRSGRVSYRASTASCEQEKSRPWSGGWARTPSLGWPQRWVQSALKPRTPSTENKAQGLLARTRSRAWAFAQTGTGRWQQTCRPASGPKAEAGGKALRRSRTIRTQVLALWAPRSQEDAPGGRGPKPQPLSQPGVGQGSGSGDLVALIPVPLLSSHDQLYILWLCPLTLAPPATR